MRLASSLIVVIGVAAIGLGHPAAADPGDELGDLIQQRLRADGPFFTGEERAVIERACGYAPGEWDGYQVNMSNDTLTCTNGRRAGGPEVRAVMRAAQPRISARVSRVMNSPEVEAAIARVAEDATAQAMAEVRARFRDED